MKNRIALICLVTISMLSCKSQKAFTASGSYEVTSPCPEKTECTITVFDNKSLLVKSDDTGRIYYQMQDAPGKKVVQYLSKKIVGDARLQDAGYNEYVVFETDNSMSNLNNSGMDMQKAKVLFGKMCFCPDAGYFKVESGTMSFDGKTLDIQLPKSIEGQKTERVTVVLK